MAFKRAAHNFSTIGLILWCGVVFFICTLIVSGCSSASQQEYVERLNSIARPFNPSDISEKTVDAAPLELTIASVGDIIFHYPWMQEFDEEGTSLYPEYFRYTKELLGSADVALCNVEGPIAGGELAGYPLFNMGDSIAPAVKEAGIDVVYTAHNHMLDQYAEGVLRTQQILRESGLHTTGSRLKETEPNYAFIDAQGLRIAVIAYTYESSPNMINGLPVPEEMDPLINSYTAGDEEDLTEMKTVIDESKMAGADLVIFYLHTGTEYAHEPNADQLETAQFLADNGADIIFSSHVHVVQSMELLQPADGTAPVPVYWSMGNYISSQIIEGGMQLENEEAVLAQVSLTWNRQTKQLDSIEMDYVPLWTCYDPTSERLMYTTVPEIEDQDLAENPSIQATGHLERAQSAFEEVREIMGESIKWKRGVKPGF